MNLLTRGLIGSIVLIVLGAVHAQSPEAVAGQWEGTIDTPDPLKIQLTLEAVNETLQGTVDIPVQGASGLSLDDIALEKDEIEFAIPDVQGAPNFTGTVVDDQIEGTFTQEGQEFPFTLQRMEEAEQAEDDADEVYRDPEERFSVPLPPNWEVAEREGYVLLTDPEAEIHLYLLVIDEEDLDEAVAEAWREVDSAFDLEVAQTLEPPPDPGVEQTLQLEYAPDEPEKLHQAFAQRHQGKAYVLLVEAERDAAQRRAAQVNIVATGLQIAAIEAIDVTDVEPLPVDEVLAELEAFIHDTLDTFGIPGAAVAIVQDGEIVYSEGFGVKERGSEEPVTPDTHMMIGSTGKTLTTLLMATLVDNGRMAWETPATEVLAEFEVADAERTEQTTVEHLVCACTGVPRRDLPLIFNADRLSAEALIESVQDFEFFTDFGEAFQYSNQLVATGGYAAAAADGASFGDLFDGYANALHERVLEPTGMPHTTLSFEEVRAREAHGVPHQLDLQTGRFESTSLEIETFLLPAAPAGAHWSTATDMAHYLKTLLAAGVTPDGERLVAEETLEALWEPQVDVADDESYGLGWFVSDYGGLPLVSHGGITLGFSSDFALLPDAGLGVVVLANAREAGPFNTAVRERLFELVYQQPEEAQAQLEFALSELEEMQANVQERLLEQVDPEALEPYLGSYSNNLLGEVTLTLKGDRLMMAMGAFETELLPALDDDGEVEQYLTVTPPLRQLPVVLTEDDAGHPAIQVGEDAESYTLRAVE